MMKCFDHPVGAPAASPPLAVPLPFDTNLDRAEVTL